MATMSLLLFSVNKDTELDLTSYGDRFSDYFLSHQSTPHGLSIDTTQAGLEGLTLIRLLEPSAVTGRKSLCSFEQGALYLHLALGTAPVSPVR